MTSKCTKVPKLRRQKRLGRDLAFVQLAERRVYLGVYGSAEARQRYTKAVAEWEAAGRRSVVPQEAITVAELLAAFWKDAEVHYRKPDGTPTSELKNLRYAFKPLAEIYANTKAAEFGPRALKTVRGKMVGLGWCRRSINKCIGRTRMLFKFGVEAELIPASVHHALQAVRSLGKGRSEAKEREPIHPVCDADIEAVRPHVSRQVWALIQLQLLTGARPGEIVGLRSIDIADTDKPVWTVELEHHKTEHHGKRRTIYLGPRAKTILEPFLTDRPVNKPLFSPREAEEDRHQAAETHRREDQTPNPVLTDRSVGDCYTTDSYRRAIDRACRLAKIPSWSPHRLRHTAATNFRRQFGVESAKVLLGHSTLSTTLLYAEDDTEKAVETMRRIG